jgi:hypothetical protein
MSGHEASASMLRSPESMMLGSRRFGVFTICALIAGVVAGAAAANAEFPFERELILQAKPISPAKRLPMLMVEANGNATIDLWCKSVPGRVELDADTIRITAPPLPAELPPMMARGQCTPERMAADESTLAMLTQATGWRRRGDGIELLGPQTLVFRPATN